jgi:hypothetical protein
VFGTGSPLLGSTRFALVSVRLAPLPGLCRRDTAFDAGALAQCNVGERVLLRFANLGFVGASLNLTGIRMRRPSAGATTTPPHGESSPRYQGRGSVNDLQALFHHVR